VPEAIDFQAGELAPQSGDYQMHNVFGSPTRLIIQLEEGDTFPDTPRSCTWHLLERSDEDRKEARTIG
jgi:hypothetical protein